MPGHLNGDEPATAPPWLPIGPDPDPVGAEDVTDEIAEDVLGVNPDQDGGVDPTWGPPEGVPGRGRDRGRGLGRLIPGVVMVLAAAFLFGAAAWTLDPTPELRDAFLPVDGEHQAMQINDAPGQVEHALGKPGSLSSIGLIGNAIANDNSADWWYDSHLYLVLAHTATDSVQVIFEVTDAKLTLEGIVTPKTAFVALPGLVLSGDREDARDHWQAKGSAGLTGQHETEYTAEVSRTDKGDCSTWTTVLKPPSGRLVEHIQLEMCRGRGLQKLDYRTDSGESIRLDAVADGHPAGKYEAARRDATPAWQDLQTWRPGPVVVNSTGGFGRGEVFAESQVPPVLLDSGLIVLANMYDQNVTAIDPGSASGTAGKPAGSGDVRWRSHPGGTLVAMAAAGNMTVVATTHRQLVAYDENGMRVWTAETPELVTAMTLAGPQRLITSLGSGEVTAVDLRNGHQLWSTDLPDVGVGQIVANELVVGVADATGTVQGLAAATGEVLTTSTSSNSLPIVDLAVSSNRLVTLRTSRLEVFDLKTGRFLWGDTLPASGVGVAVTDDVVVYGGPGTTRVAELSDGDRVADLPASEQVRSLGGRPVIIDGSLIRAVGSDGEEGPTWDLGDPLRSVNECQCTLGRSGLVISTPSGLVMIR